MSSSFKCLSLAFALVLSAMLLVDHQLMAQPAAQPPLIDLAAAEGKLIREITIKGLSQNSEGEVLSQLRIFVEESLKRQDLNDSYLDLWRTGKYLSIDEPKIYQLADGLRIVIELVERQLIHSVSLQGVRSADESILSAQLQTKKDGFLSPRLLRRDADRITSELHKRGFIFATVQHLTSPTGKAVRVVFKVEEGPKVRVGEINFKGNDSLPDSELLKWMGTAQRSWLWGIPNPGLFNKLQYLADLQNLRQYYLSKGFFDVVVASEDFAFNLERNRVHLSIRIVEGKRYKISDCQFTIVGNGVFPESILREKLKFSIGDYFEEKLIFESRIELERLYKNKSHIDARVEKELIFPLEGEKVKLVLRVREGEKVFAENIVIKGNAETMDKVIRRQIVIHPGEPMNIDNIEESVSNLRRLNFFKVKSPIMEAGSTQSQRNIVFEVEEGSTGSFNFGFGVTSSRGLIGVMSLTKRNFDILDMPDGILDIPDAFTGAGQNLVLQAQPGTSESRYRLEFREPHLMDSPTSLSLRLFRDNFDRNDYDEKRVAGEIAFGYRFPELRRWWTELAYRYELVDIGNIDVTAAPDVFAVDGETRLSGLRLRSVYDARRFNEYGPVNGWIVDGSYEYLGGFLGADVDISKAKSSFTIYKSLHNTDGKKHHILSFKSSVAWSEGHHNTDDVPIFEREFLGGARSLRGYRFRGVGPHFNKDAIGGTAMHYGSLEYTFPIFGDTIRGIGFGDYGNLDAGLNSFATDRYRFAAGAGVLLNLDFFGQRLPISLTWGQAFEDQDQDRTRVFLFDIGRGF